jgi:tubulin polyglutamylase TTLL6/13
MCFEILGFDIFLDHKCRPWLLEVNHSPSFTTDTPLDHSIKDRVISDALSLLDLCPDNRKLLGKVRKPRLRNDKDLRLERIRREHRAQELCHKLEESHRGGFQKIYPDSECPEQEELLTAATRLWNERNPRSQRLERREEKPKPKSSVSPFKWQAEPQQEEPLRSSVIAQLRTQARLTVSQSPLQDQTTLRSKVLQLKAEALRRLPNGIFVKPRLVALEGLGDSVS